MRIYNKERESVSSIDENYKKIENLPPECLKSTPEREIP